MLFGILFTGLQTVSMAFLKRGKRGHSDLGWLANFQADSLPLIRIVLFDRIKESLTLSEHQKLGILCSRQTHLVFRKLCIVHVLGLISYCQYICQNKTSYLIPVLLDTTLCSLGERLPLHSVSHSCATPTSNITRQSVSHLRDICPAIPRISHSPQPLLFSRRPGSVCSTFFRRWAHRWRAHAWFFLTTRRRRYGTGGA
jgi:hypothetical protein